MPSAQQSTSHRLFLIDAFGFIFRAYHARARTAAPPMRTTSGISTEAIYIFHNMLRKLETSYQPEYIAAVFESGRTFREDTLYAVFARSYAHSDSAVRRLRGGRCHWRNRDASLRKSSRRNRIER